jgi:hypothetical protein
MKIELNIPAETIANMMCSAIESGDPVTTAIRGGWCAGIYWQTKSAEPPKGNWWIDDPSMYDKSNLQLEIHEVADEDTFDWDKTDAENVASGALVIHEIGRDDMAKGLKIMAEKYPGTFAQVIEDNTDAPCADIFLQCVCFGEEKYA